LIKKPKDYIIFGHKTQKMAKFIKIWKYRLFKYLPYLFKRHFLNQILTGRFKAGARPAHQNQIGRF